MAATRDSWKSHPFPESQEPIPLVREYTGEEFARLREGHIPTGMEDHWFAVFEEPWLYLHRSWSGVAVYRVRFEFANDRWIIVESLINRDPQQQWRSVPDSDSEVTVLGIRLDAWAGRIADAKAAQAALFERRKVALKRRKRGANDGS